MRAFHCGVEDAAQDNDDSASDADADAAVSKPRLQYFACNPLDMPQDLYRRLKDTKDTLHCPNCLTGVHQCFKCKQEGVVSAHAAEPANIRFADRLVFRCSAVC